jgi:hypothetical protein
MRGMLIAIVTTFCFLGAASQSPAGSYQSNGTYVGTPSSVVTRLFASHPKGGEGLVNAIRELLINDPTLADDVAYVAARSNLEQQMAAGAGMSQAFKALVNRGDNGAAARIVNAAQQSGSSSVQLAVAGAVGTAVGLSTLAGGNPMTGTSCTTVSPASKTCQ